MTLLQTHRQIYNKVGHPDDDQTHIHTQTYSLQKEIQMTIVHTQINYKIEILMALVHTLTHKCIHFKIGNTSDKCTHTYTHTN